MTGSALGGAAGRLSTVGTATPVSTTFTGGRGVHTSARRARAAGTVSATVSRAAVGRFLRLTSTSERQQRGEKHGPPGPLSRANQTDDRQNGVAHAPAEIYGAAARSSILRRRASMSASSALHAWPGGFFFDQCGVSAYQTDTSASSWAGVRCVMLWPDTY